MSIQSLYERNDILQHILHRCYSAILQRIIFIFFFIQRIKRYDERSVCQLRRAKDDRRGGASAAQDTDAQDPTASRKSAQVHLWQTYYCQTREILHEDRLGDGRGSDADRYIDERRRWRSRPDRTARVRRLRSSLDVEPAASAGDRFINVHAHEITSVAEKKKKTDIKRGKQNKKTSACCRHALLLSYFYFSEICSIY